MKQGMNPGLTETIEMVVTPELFASFGGQVVHEALSTVAMVYYMEWASRKIILPYLEDSEEGMGAAVSVKHIAPASVGESITFTASVSKLEKNYIWTEVKAEKDQKLLGIGTVKQVILPKAKIDEMLASS